MLLIFSGIIDDGFGMVGYFLLRRERLRSQ
jgi:hypothetical protein